MALTSNLVGRNLGLTLLGLWLILTGLLPLLNIRISSTVAIGAWALPSSIRHWNTMGGSADTYPSMAASKSHPPQAPRDKATPAASPAKKIRAGMGDVESEFVEVWSDDDYRRA